MDITFKRFSLPKKASSYKDNQDATFPNGSDYEGHYAETLANKHEFRCALADGATDAVFSKRWAEILIEGYAANEWSEQTICSESLACARERWRSHVAVKELPWYTIEKAKFGAAAAVVTLRIMETGNRWTGVAVGDSCLFHVRNGAVIARLPEMGSKDFSSDATLLSSSDDNDTIDFRKMLNSRDNDSWQDGDQFLLMSDALACWFAREIEEGRQRQAIALLARMSSQEEFERFVREERERYIPSGACSLNDDDTTLMVIEVRCALRVVRESSEQPEELPPLKELSTENPNRDLAYKLNLNLKFAPLSRIARVATLILLSVIVFCLGYVSAKSLYDKPATTRTSKESTKGDTVKKKESQPDSLKSKKVKPQTGNEKKSQPKNETQKSESRISDVGKHSNSGRPGGDETQK